MTRYHITAVLNGSDWIVSAAYPTKAQAEAVRAQLEADLPAGSTKRYVLAKSSRRLQLVPKQEGN